MYLDNLASYYDILHSKKNYNEECNLITQNSTNYDYLLDIGCGTLNHSIILSKKFDKIVAIDLSEPMVKVGEKKIKDMGIMNIKTHIGNLNETKFSNQFDTIISMFYVVNHINTINELNSFFNEIFQITNKNGVFIFDCWNGTACRIDKPNIKNTKEININKQTIISETTTKTNLMKSISVMDTNVKIYDNKKLIGDFNYTINQRLWTPDIFDDILMSVGFKNIKTIPFYNQNETPKETDYKLTYICKK